MKKLELLLLLAFLVAFILRLNLILPYRLYSAVILIVLSVFYFIWSIGSLKECSIKDFFINLKNTKIQWNGFSQGIGCALGALGVFCMEYLIDGYRFILWSAVLFIFASFIVELVKLVTEHYQVGRTIRRSILWLTLCFTFLSSSESFLVRRIYKGHHRFLQLYEAHTKNPDNKHYLEMFRREFDRVEEQMRRR